MSTFPAWVVREDPANPKRRRAALEEIDETALDDLPVTIDVTHSSLNYKDALALGGRAGVVRRTPLVAGIDLVGEVTASLDDRFAPGDAVMLHGAGLGEDRHGGLARRARVDADALLPVPAPFTPAQAAAIGTAGLTAALAVLALERHGLRSDAGPVLVTGASGGAGSIALALLAAAGYEAVAVTGRPEQMGERLRGLGAADVLDRSELEAEGRPLAAQRWAGAVDGVGGRILANILAGTRADGAVAAYGLAASPDLPATVLPFILRGVSLLGVNSVEISRPLREAAWDRLARDLDPALLDSLTRTVPLGAAQETARELLEGKGTGRVLVDVQS